jgi:hypothetical protein
MGRGGWRSVLQPAQRWMASLPSAASCHHQPLSSPMGGFIRKDCAMESSSGRAVTGVSGYLSIGYLSKNIIEFEYKFNYVTEIFNQGHNFWLRWPLVYNQ